MSDLDLTDAVEAGHRALHTHYRHPDPDAPSYRSDVWIALRAAAPSIERQVRDRVAEDILAQFGALEDADDMYTVGVASGLELAARIARGVS